MNRLIGAVWVTGAIVVACGGSEQRLGGRNPVKNAAEGAGGAKQGSGAETAPIDNPITMTPGYGEPTTPHDFAAGKWQGYIELGDDLLLELDTLSETGVTGKLIFGDATAPVPDYSDPSTKYDGKRSSASVGSPVASYPYTLVEGTLAARRLRFRVISDEVWQPWCSQQTPIPDEVNAGAYGCARNVSYTSDKGRCWVTADPSQTLDCARQALCSLGPCGCTSTSCSVTGNSSADFDVMIQGDHMDGSATVNGTHNVHFTTL